jgi:hypothetical protein
LQAERDLLAGRNGRGLKEAAAGKPLRGRAADAGDVGRGRGEGALEIVVPFVSGRREIADALGHHGRGTGIDRPGELEKRLIDPGGVIDDDLAAGRLQRLHAVGEVLLGVEGGVEIELRRGRGGVDQLGHCLAFVAAAGRSFLEHRDAGGGQQPLLDRRRGAAVHVVAVGHDADLDAGSADAVGAARHRTAQRRIGKIEAGQRGAHGGGGIRVGHRVSCRRLRRRSMVPAVHAGQSGPCRRDRRGRLPPPRRCGSH